MSSVFYDVMISVDRRAVTANNLLGPAILLKPVLDIGLVDIVQMAVYSRYHVPISMCIAMIVCLN